MSKKKLIEVVAFPCDQEEPRWFVQWLKGRKAVTTEPHLFEVRFFEMSPAGWMDVYPFRSYRDLFPEIGEEQWREMAAKDGAEKGTAGKPCLWRILLQVAGAPDYREGFFPLSWLLHKGGNPISEEVFLTRLMGGLRGNWKAPKSFRVIVTPISYDSCVFCGCINDPYEVVQKDALGVPVCDICEHELEYHASDNWDVLTRYYLPQGD